MKTDGVSGLDLAHIARREEAVLQTAVRQEPETADHRVLIRELVKTVVDATDGIFYGHPEEILHAFPTKKCVGRHLLPHARHHLVRPMDRNGNHQLARQHPREQGGVRLHILLHQQEKRGLGDGI